MSNRALDRLIHAQGGLCFFCKEPIEYPTIEHVIPLSSKAAPRHVTRSVRNMVAACARCNHGKGPHPPTDTELRRLMVLKREKSGEAEHGDWLLI